LETLDLLSKLALLAFPPLLGLVTYLFKKKDEDSAEDRKRMEKDLRSLLAKEAGDRLLGEAELERKLDASNQKLSALQREVDKDYVNFERLDAIMRPMRELLDQLGHDLRDGQREIFDRLDGKQDKVRGSD
jgi:hypothetical protein